MSSYDNESSEKYELIMAKEERLILLMFNYLHIIIGGFFNMLVVATFLLVYELRRYPNDVLILNLAIADFIYLATFQTWLTITI